MIGFGDKPNSLICPNPYRCCEQYSCSTSTFTYLPSFLGNVSVEVYLTAFLVIHVHDRTSVSALLTWFTCCMTYMHMYMYNVHVHAVLWTVIHVP